MTRLLLAGTPQPLVWAEQVRAAHLISRVILALWQAGQPEKIGNLGTCHRIAFILEAVTPEAWYT